MQTEATRMLTETRLVLSNTEARAIEAERQVLELAKRLQEAERDKPQSVSSLRSTSSRALPPAPVLTPQQKSPSTSARPVDLAVSVGAPTATTATTTAATAASGDSRTSPSSVSSQASAASGASGNKEKVSGCCCSISMSCLSRLTLVLDVSLCDCRRAG